MSAKRRAHVPLLMPVAACMALLVPASLSLAQDAAAPSSRVGVLRATHADAPEGLAVAVDAALLRDLESLAGIADPMISPVDYTEIQITLGCEDASRQCLTSIAQSAQVEALLVRRLDRGKFGTVSLELLYFDSSRSDEPTSVQASAPADRPEALTAAMPGLVRKLFGIPQPEPEPAVVATEPSAPEASAAPAPKPARAPIAPQREPGADTGISAWSWLALGTGAAAFGTGIVLGLAANSGYDDFQSTRVSTPAQAARANADLDAVRTKGTLANVLVPAGAAVLALGATLLVIDLTSGADGANSSHTRLQLQPARSGAMLTLHGSLDGASP